MKLLAKTCISFAMLVMLGACANDPVKEQTADAKPINYGCRGTSLNDCMTFHTPVTGGKLSR
ncbi:MAG TPA: hypothetical protein PLE99_07200 [Candidatus Thiothrix moscowensis]|uniref:hypothetical protein n=1 Tax=unclassified Thiothrix TaxID=2636184 RepID=UPI0025F721EA|nr:MULTISPECIES: hypothetical protein [unclassified Thiothrix]HRJ52536.1 hypothetical protein [Candidatus Thiothrix moscowensis]HRJ93278.1 hypothetical protein [Candidatus Thiothrix moscowensis]